MVVIGSERRIDLRENLDSSGSVRKLPAMRVESHMSLDWVGQLRCEDTSTRKLWFHFGNASWFFYQRQFRIFR
jgi:hypothetical protein